MFSKSQTTFKNRNDRDVEIIRLFEVNRTNNVKKIENFVKSHKLSCVPWEPSFDNFCYDTYSGDSYAIMFSGGLDSLSLALRHLEKKERVFLISVGFNKDEQCNAWLTVQILKKLYGSERVIFLNVFPAVVLTGNESTYGLCQQPICAFYAAWIPAQIMKTVKAVECAYVMNDDALSFLDELKAIYNNTMRLKYFLDESVVKTPLNFPLTQVPHSENARYISSIEEKYNVIFPTLSAERIRVQKLESKHDVVYIIEGSQNQEKPNKECDAHAYIAVEHYRKLTKEHLDDKFICKPKSAHINALPL